jgi:hypothetical protein
VAACGVRKLWAKEFELYPKPSQRIRRLKEILSDLGMAGRFTIQQAKAIKEKRELAQELGMCGYPHPRDTMLTTFLYMKRMYNRSSDQ